MKTRRRGILLVTLLVITTLVVMLAGALLSTQRQGFLQVAQQRDRMRAAELARGGLNHLIHLLTYDPSFSSPVSQTLDDGSYTITFSSSDPNRSVNNLQGAGVAPISNFLAKPVQAHTCDVVVVGTCAATQMRVHAVVGKGFSFNRSAGAQGKIQMSGDVKIDGIASLLSPGPAPVDGGLYSRFAATTTANAIGWSSSGGTYSLTAGPSSRLLTVAPASGSQSFAPDIVSSVLPSQLSQKGSGDLPSFDVSKAVTAGLGNPAPTGLSNPSPGNFALGSSCFTDKRSINGNLQITGDVTLNGGTLFVHGDLVVDGGIKGAGSIFVDGNVRVRGGNCSILTNQPSGAALCASGNLNLEGLNSQGYLNSLATTYPAVNQDLTVFNSTMSAIASKVNAADLNGAFGLTNQLVREYYNPGGLPSTYPGPAWRATSTTGYFINPIKAPNGNYPDGNSDGDIPALINSIKSSLGPAYASDASAQRVVGALQEVHYQFRRNWDGCNGNLTVVDNQLVGVPNFAAYNAGPRIWYNNGSGNHCDDITLPLSNLCLDSLFGGGSMWGSLSADQKAAATAGYKNWFISNPLDLSWIGKSYFQGVVYAQGNVTADSSFTVVGSLLSQGDITLSNNCTLIYDAEYLHTVGEMGPLQAQVYEEL